MKERELREHAKCSLCRKPIGASGAPFFYRVRLEHFVVDLDAVSRQQGLATQLGGSALLAAAMGPDEDMAHRLDETTCTVCADCALHRSAPVVELYEHGRSAEQQDQEAR